MSDDTARRPGESISEYAKRRAALFGYNLGEALERPQIQHVKAPPVTWDADLIPDIGPVDDYQRQSYEIDEVLDKVDIVDAYIRWCGKMIPVVGNKTESIMVSCPNPSHSDAHPSAWLSLGGGKTGAKNVGHCSACAIGFDKYDIAAWRFGYSVPGYKTTDFVELRQKMAEDLGYTLMVRGKDQWLVNKSEPLTVVSRVSPIVDAVEPQVVVSSSDNSSSDTLDTSTIVGNIKLDWQSIPATQGDTFLAQWMRLTKESHEPEEYYLWLGLLALGCAVGNNATYEDMMPVRPNLMLCLVGTTGTGKSISISVMENLIRDALPFDEAIASGVRMISSPGSGEVFIDQFSHWTVDPSDPAKTKVFHPVNGLYRESELASFVKRTSRAGSTIREVSMDLYDRPAPVQTASRGVGFVTARGHFMQMVTSTQPDSINRLLTDSDSAAGFLNRWVFGFGDYKVRPPRGAQRIDTSICVDLLRSVRAWASPGRSVTWEPGPAADLWDKFYLERIEPLTRADDAQLLARMPLLAKKLLLLFAINEGVTVITVAHVESLMAMWDYLLACYGVVNEHAGVGDLEACAQDIEKYVESRPGEVFTFRTLKKQSGARKYSTEIIKKALETMMWAAIVEEVPRQKTDRVPRYTYVQHSSAPMATVTSITRTV